jgi:hypothetical protein
MYVRARRYRDETQLILEICKRVRTQGSERDWLQLATSLFDPEGHGGDPRHKNFVIPMDVENDGEVDPCRRRLPRHLALMSPQVMQEEPTGPKYEAVLKKDDPPHEYRQFFIGNMNKNGLSSERSIVVKVEDEQRSTVYGRGRELASAYGNIYGRSNGLDPGDGDFDVDYSVDGASNT